MLFHMIFEDDLSNNLPLNQYIQYDKELEFLLPYPIQIDKSLFVHQKQLCLAFEHGLLKTPIK